MKHSEIQIGDVLRLKEDRREAYGLTYAHVLVTGIQERPGYTVPWIETSIGMMRPTDFKCSLATERGGMSAQIRKNLEAVTRG